MKYPIGIQSFREIREGGYVYVDKTRQIHDLVSEGKYFFLSRPRRFGKSLLLSTLYELYTGQEALFRDLWIHAHWDWEAALRPVVWLKFASFGYKQHSLKEALEIGLREEAARLGLDSSKVGHSHILSWLIREAYNTYGQKVVILIDEYDKPIIDYLDDIPKAEENRDTLKWLYSVLKDADPYIEFLFLTGVSAFSKVSIFSDLNNLSNITLSPQGYTLLGITQEELDTVFEAPMQAYDRSKVREWYNGYSWGGEERLYNPFSILRFLQSGQYQNYWFETGTPTFLVREMRKHRFYNMSGFQTAINDLVNFDYARLNPISVLFQTGYLTIRDYDSELLIYTLDYPNREVRSSLEQLLMSEYMDYPPQGALPRVVNILQALRHRDLEAVVEILNAAFAEIPYEHWQKENEHFYHALIHLTFSLLGAYTRSEVHTARGRCDALVETADYLYAFEFKLDRPVAEALQQIREKGYLSAYADSPKEKIGVGVSFSTAQKGIVDWAVEGV
ncbi:MAG: AAA family ATPase [Phaeodactylibacter sp.]|uniref:ATP-binding protein n=1 Tax=Phaeodactylibacter sp. TaxID=1940289 RepID=UPI0032EE1644